jgi:GT2 family glycosyltransferase
LERLNGPETEVVVIDNASTDGTAAAIAAEFPRVRIVRTEQRLGYAPANNLGFRHACGRYLIVLNPDTRVDPDFVHALVETSKRHNDRALATSRICMFDRPDTINACGNSVQFALLAACRGIGEPASRHTAESVVASISGCAFLIPRTVLELIDPFEESIFPYLEDTELSVRASIAGLRCVLAPDSVVYHKYSLRLTPRKFFFIERNRWLVMLRSYRLRTLALLVPALVLVEASAWGYAASLGGEYLRAKARSYAGIAHMLPGVWNGRREMNALRRVGDRALLERFEAALPVGQLMEDVKAPRRLIRLVNAGLDIYFRFVRRVVRW